LTRAGERSIFSAVASVIKVRVKGTAYLIPLVPMTRSE
jgi:hypothetical protein